MRVAILVLVLCSQSLAVFITGCAKGTMKTSMDVVRYEDFGALGDGKTDDIEAIAKAHEFANLHGLPVRASGHATYYIAGRDRTAVIQTDTDFGAAQFIIDDTAAQKISSPVFEVRSVLPVFKPEGITSLKRDQRKIPIVLPGRCVVHITNSNVKHYIRKGLNRNNGTSQTDMFLVDAEGRVAPDTPITWDFDQITDVIAYQVDAKVLTIKGGRFTTIANAAESKYTYYGRGISIKRSTVILDGLEHRITGEGGHGAPYRGFVDIHDCADVTVRNSLFTAHKTYRTIGSANAPVSMGSYDLSVGRALNVVFENCRQTNDINDNRYWGILGSNFCKNLRFEGCVFSRFDAHQGVYNATIRNSTIGYMGILAIGKGTLLVENTTVRAGNFIGLRPDYGSTWQGEVIIRNCVFVPPAGRPATLISGSNDGDHDFGYPCTMPERVTIDTLRIEDAGRPADAPGPALFGNFCPLLKDSTYKQAYPYRITREVILDGVTTSSGKPLRVSDNAFMFKDVVVRQARK
jgi:hypothetical protein